MNNKDNATPKRPLGATRPFPWRCRECGKKDVDMSETDYKAEVRHDGRLHTFTVQRLKIPICRSCGAKVFTEDVDEQINRALRAHLTLLAPEQIRSALDRLNLSQKEVARRLRMAEATVSRWLNEIQIQSGSMDTLLRVFFAFPQVRAILSNDGFNPDLGLADLENDIRVGSEQSSSSKTPSNPQEKNISWTDEWRQQRKADDPAEDFTLFDSFQKRGYWWLPSFPDTQVPGILVRTEKEIRLELFGDLQEEPLSEKGIVKPRDPTPIILGWLEDQSVCTLYKNHKTNERTTFPGTTTSTEWSSQALFIGDHFPEEEKIMFSSLGINYTNLEQWVAHPPFKAPNCELEGQKLTRYESIYVARDSIDVQLPTLDATLKFECVAWFSNGFQSRTQQYTEFASLYPNKPQHLDWFLSAFQDCANLLTLLIGEPVWAKRIVGSPVVQNDANDATEKDVFVYLNHSNRRESNIKHLAEMLVPLPSIKHWFVECFQKWFENASTLRDVYNLFFGSLYAPGPFLQSDFMSLVQALESFSRTRKNGSYVKKKEYEPIKKQLLAAIPGEIDEGLKESLESRIHFGNEHTLKRRIEDMLASIDDDTLKLFCPDKAAFTKKVKVTRNYLAHWDVKSKKKALHGPALWVANQRLRLLLTIQLLKEIGVKEDSLRQKLKQDPKWMQLIHLYLEKGAC